MSENNNNFLIAMALSFIVLMGWMYFIGQPQMKAESARQAQLAHQQAKVAAQPVAPHAAGAAANLGRADALKLGGARVAIDTPTVDGSLLLKGAVFDDLRLKNYHVTLDKKSSEIVLPQPKGTSFPYYAMFGWVSLPGAPVKLPDEFDAVETCAGHEARAPARRSCYLGQRPRPSLHAHGCRSTTST